jgi:hypothetical protein
MHVCYLRCGATMSISNFLRNMFWAVLLGGCVLSHQGEAADTQKCAAPQRTVDSTYSPGQVWSYKTRPSEGLSTVTILRVETSPKVGVIVHVGIDGVQLKNCKGGPAPTTIDHAPFTKIAMDKSVSRQLAPSCSCSDAVLRIGSAQLQNRNCAASSSATWPHNDRTTWSSSSGNI